MRAMTVFQRSEDRGTGINGSAVLGKGQKKGRVFLIGHDLFLWSPKGFLTGSPNTPGSVLVGYHFERTDVSIGCNGSTGITCTGGHLAQFHRNRILLNEWDLWYFIAPRMSMGVNVMWYDASNLRNGTNNAAHNLGICKTPVNATNCRSGIGGDWVDVFFNWRYTF
jgi:hypothetical protein